MSMAKRWLEEQPEFGADVEIDIFLETEEALTEEDADWLRWLACDFEGDDDYCIEADHDWIRRGC